MYIPSINISCIGDLRYLAVPSDGDSGLGDDSHVNLQYYLHALTAGGSLPYAESMAGYTAAVPMSEPFAEITPYLGTSCMSTPFTPFLDTSRINTSFMPPADVLESQNHYLSSLGSKDYCRSVSDQQKNVYMEENVLPPNLTSTAFAFSSPLQAVSIESTPNTADTCYYNSSSSVMNTDAEGKTPTGESSGISLFPPLFPDEHNSYSLTGGSKQNESTDSHFQHRFSINPIHYEATGRCMMTPFEVESRWPSSNVNSSAYIEPSNVVPTVSRAASVPASQDRPFACDICSRPFKSRGNMNDHRRRHDKNRERPFPCLQCFWRFDRKYDLKRHISTIHNGERPYRCTLCNYDCKRKDGLASHLKNCTGYCNSNRISGNSFCVI